MNDSRCERMIAQTAKYRALSVKLIERMLDVVCYGQKIHTALCSGDYDFLMVVREAAGGDISMAQVARQLEINPSSTTRRARRLLECGLISKTLDASDDRRYQIALTEKGDRFMEEMEVRMREVTHEMYAQVTEDEMTKVLSFMDKCIEGMQQALKEK